MGIKGISKYISSKHRGLYVSRAFADLRGKKIAVDLMGIVYRYKAASPDLYMQNLFAFFNRFLTNNTKLILVFEGVPLNEKKLEQERRRENIAKQKERVGMLQGALTKYKESKTMTSELTTLLERNEVKLNIGRNIIWTDVDDQVEDEKEFENLSDTLEVLIQKMRDQLIPPSASDIDEIKRYYTNDANVEMLTARNEAEFECAYLCIKDKVYAVLSDDSDLIALACPRVLLRTRNKIGGDFAMYEFSNLIVSCKLRPNQIEDWCILCGCDFNTSLPNMGPASAYAVIYKYGSIEGFLENATSKEVSKFKMTKENVSALEIVACRNLFSLKDY
jgi:5'-3' exonuclease